LIRRPLVPGLGLAALVVVLDQLTKAAILDRSDLVAGRWIEVTSFFNLVLVWNTGVSFGVLAGFAAWTPWVLTGLALAVAIALALWLRRADRVFLILGLGGVMGGAVGNAIDRMHFGGVVDFLDFHLAGVHFWAFNVADAAISVGVALLVIDGLFRPSETS